MKTKLLTLFVILNFLTASIPFALAGKTRQTGDWSALRNHLDTEIAVKARNKSTVYGVLRAVEDDSLKIQVVSKKTNYETVYRKDEVEKVWQAELRSGRNVAKGALIGGGIGAGIGLIAGATAKEADPLNYAGVVLFGILGTGIGALISASKKGNKKKTLIYKI